MHQLANALGHLGLGGLPSIRAAFFGMDDNEVPVTCASVDELSAALPQAACDALRRLQRPMTSRKHQSSAVEELAKRRLQLSVLAVIASPDTWRKTTRAARTPKGGDAVLLLPMQDILREEPNAEALVGTLVGKGGTKI
eukprot:SAG25_NODE_5808_length_619_cov_1.290385_1_plen_138_part_10